LGKTVFLNATGGGASIWHHGAEHRVETKATAPSAIFSELKNGTFLKEGLIRE
jgi:hypothetical protein